jgi:signal peptidase II
MATKKLVRLALILLVMFGNIGCDQVSKNIIRTHVTPHETIAVLGNHLTVTNVENSGAMMSIGDSLPVTTKNILLSALPLLILALTFIYTLRKKNLPNPILWGLCFIMGGGVGNLFDRIMYGSVTDFLHIEIGIFQTAVFNMADVSIVVGTLLILFHTFFRRKETPLPGQS